MYDLKTYLRNVYELEASSFEQKRTISSLKSRISSLPSKPSEASTSCSIFLGVIGLGIGAALGFWALTLLSSNEPFVPIFGLLVLVGAGFFLFWGVIGTFVGTSETVNDKRRYDAALTRYNNGLTVRTALASEIPALKSKLASTQQLLRAYYAKGILHDKYKNFVAVAYLLDCIDTGRCTQLDGPNGAYNQFELEVRMDRISSQLDTVIDKLDQIRQNQYSLYAAITQANRTNEHMLQKLDGYCRNLESLNSSSEEIRRSLNTANRTAELTRKEISYRNYLDHGTRYSN